MKATPSYDQVITLLAQVRGAIYPLRNKGHLGYAITYIDAVPDNETEGRLMGYRKEESLQTQVLYILSNLGVWSGEQARSAKATLKAFATAKL